MLKEKKRKKEREILPKCIVHKQEKEEKYGYTIKKINK